MTAPLPVLFVGHGSPMNAIEDTPFRRAWTELGAALPRPRAILCVSAHWETRGVALTASERPETIHDFGGFPQALFDVRYPAPGAPWLAKRAAELLADTRPVLDPTRGLDHGAWGMLVALYPQADVPVVQLSLDVNRTPAQHYALAQALGPLRDEGVLVVASGDIVHNLRAADFRRPEAPDWAVRFDKRALELVQARDHAALIDYPALGPDAMKAIPTPEHYLPLLYALALQRPGEEARVFNEAVFAAISMTSLVIGG